MKRVCLILAVLMSISAYGQSCLGEWTTFDDDTHKKKSVVKLYRKDGIMYGKILKLYPEKGRSDDPLCEKCKGSLKNKPVVGMIIVRGMKWSGSEWEGGTIVDPENGEKYKSKMWLDSDHSNLLNVRGYVGPFYRTQIWIRKK